VLARLCVQIMRVRLCVQIMRIHHIPLVVNVIPSLRCPAPTFPSQEFGGIIFFTPELSMLFLIFLLRFFMSVVVALHFSFLFKHSRVLENGCPSLGFLQNVIFLCIDIVIVIFNKSRG